MFTIGLSFTKEDEESPWETFLVSAYNGEDWIFHDEANLKSSRGVLNLENLESLNRDVSGGKVTEYSVIDLTEETFNKYCDIIQADNVLFRLRGTEISDVQGQMTETSRRAEKAMCVVGLGLRQGFIP
jgi:hypothetical protein